MIEREVGLSAEVVGNSSQRHALHPRRPDPLRAVVLLEVQCVALHLSAEQGERIGARGGFETLKVRDRVDCYADQAPAILEALKDLVADPVAMRGLGTV